MVILIDRNSASASEIWLAQCKIKEGIIIMKRVMAKEPYNPLSKRNKSALKISIAEYRTAAGRIIDKTGIT
ncbi:MAG: S41 family peptidase [Dialister invisus]